MLFPVDVLDQIGAALDEYFVHPIIAQRQLQSVPFRQAISKANIIGAPDRPIALVRSDDTVYLLGKTSALLTSPFIRELGLTDNKRVLLSASRDFELLQAPLRDALRRRLEVPVIVLVNLFHPDMYPTPRLTLGISYIASYLRERNSADVVLFDCQFPMSIPTLVANIKRTCAKIVGLSVNFGQLNLLDKFMDALYREMENGNLPVVALGNIVPSMSAPNLLERYPNAIICQRDGEAMMDGLARHFHDRAEWQAIPGAVFRSASSNEIIRTQPQIVEMNTLPPPAFDLAAETLDRRGVITGEFSRGCHYNICSFCSRTHKASSWRGMYHAGFTRHLQAYTRLFSNLGYSPYIFFADEEFIGAETDGFDQHGRVSQFLHSVKGLSGPIRFDAATRTDQAFADAHDDAWHQQRGKMFQSLVDVGLKRLFVGVESGSNGQLLRYNKGTDVDGNVSALRYLSMLGIKLRFGFITFDPLMSAEELCENVEFLTRTDVVLPEADADIDQIFAFVRSHHGEDVAHLSGPFVFEEVSYVASPLEVLLKSRYLAEARKTDPRLLSPNIDVGFARVEFQYRNPLIQTTSNLCQRWINYCFPIVYTLKGLQKTSDGPLATTLGKAIRSYRAVTYYLLRSLVSSFGLTDSERAAKWEQKIPTPINITSLRCHSVCTTEQVTESGELILSQYVEYFRNGLHLLDSELRLSAASLNSWHSTYSKWLMEGDVPPRSVREK